MAFAIVVVLAFIGLPAPFYFFDDDDTVEIAKRTRRENIALVVVILALLLVPFVLEDIARSAGQRFSPGQFVGALLGTGFAASAIAVAVRGRCSVHTGGKWVPGSLYVYEGKPEAIRVALVRGVVALGLLSVAIVPVLR